ncbi:MAG: type III polyketide synthase [Tepidiformaceae bacterium]
MEIVRLTRAASAHPKLRISQEDATRTLACLAPGDRRRIEALAKGSHIASRAMALSPRAILKMDSAARRNQAYHELAPPLIAQAARQVLDEGNSAKIGCLVTSSCTGYSVPGLGVQLSADLALSSGTTRLPITESGCAGGVVAIARATDFVRSHPNHSALTAAVELCSLAFHPGGDEGNLTSALIFGDGAGAALIEPGPGDGLEIIDSSSTLIPDSQHLLGFDLTDAGFYPLLDRRLGDVLARAIGPAVECLLSRNGLAIDRVGAWLMHPGGARILTRTESQMGLTREPTRWSWDSLREHGNTSSAAIFDVIARYLGDEAARGEFVIIAGFGPGVSIELVLGRRA